MKKEIDFTDIHQICAEHQIKIRELESVSGSFGKNVFFINQELLLRVSEAPMTLEQEKFRRIATLNFVPKIVHTGTLKREAGPIHYTFLTLLPGDDFVNAYPETTEDQQAQLGVDVAGFLDNLQEFHGGSYDIGLYVAALPHFSGTWRDGHQQYWELLEQESGKLHLKPDSLQVFDRAFRFLQVSAQALAYQSGSRLLHNDFHPRNILVHQGKFSGVIDWECSQFGEADFELCHLVHWCLYPPESSINFGPFLRALLKASPHCAQTPDLTTRLTIYQIEHEIQQIIWNSSEAETWRVSRLAHWIDGGVDDLFREIGFSVAGT